MSGYIDRSVQTLAVVILAFAFDRVMSFIHEGLHILWGVLNESQFGECGVSGIPIGARESWHGVPQFYVCIEEAGTFPHYVNPLFATIGSVLIAMFFLHHSNRVMNDVLRWGITAGAIYSGYRYSLYSGGLLNHPRLGDGQLTVWLGDGGTILSEFGELALVPAVVGVVMVSLVAWSRLKNSRDVCDCRV